MQKRSISVALCVLLPIITAVCLCSCGGGTAAGTSSTQPSTQPQPSVSSVRTPQTSVRSSTTSANPVVTNASVSPTAAQTSPVTQGAQQSPTGTMMLGSYTVKEATMLHAKPDSGSQDLIAVESGATVNVLAVQGDWGYISSSAALWGWINFADLTAKDAATAAASQYKTGKFTVNTESSPLTVRTKPDSGADGISSLEKGTAVEVLAVQSNWGYVTLTSTSGGWINMEYVK